MKAAVIMGSASDEAKVEKGIAILKEYGVDVEVRALSAHRAHRALSEFVEECNNNGTDVILTAAGMAAALPGVVASMTVLPVIGIPIKGASLDGMDALLSIVQMPSGIPVATVAIDGGMNAAIMAAKILAVSDAELLEKLKAYTVEMKEAVQAKAARLDEVGYEAY